VHRGFNLSSSCDDGDAEEAGVAEALEQARGCLLFCTPERLAVPSFAAKLKAWHAQRPFAYIVVDEAHLVAEQALLVF
tara:strand:+ start:711 stop:944 length:234 start_codon:yes stop_codon:yes gene_type:complete